MGLEGMRMTIGKVFSRDTLRIRYVIQKVKHWRVRTSKIAWVITKY